MQISICLMRHDDLHHRATLKIDSRVNQASLAHMDMDELDRYPYMCRVNPYSTPTCPPERHRTISFGYSMRPVRGPITSRTSKYEATNHTDSRTHGHVGLIETVWLVHGRYMSWTRHGGAGLGPFTRTRTRTRTLATILCATCQLAHGRTLALTFVYSDIGHHAF